MKNKVKKTKLAKEKNYFLVFFFSIAILLIPNIYRQSTIDGYTNFRFLAFSVFLVFLTVSLFFNFKNLTKKLDFSILKSRIFLAYSLYLLVIGFSIFAATNKAEAFSDLFRNFSFFILLIYTTLVIVPKEKSKIYLTKFFIVFSFIISFVGFIQLFQILNEFGFSINSVYKVSGNFAHKNIFSQVLFVALPFSLFGIYKFTDTWRKIAFLTLVANFSIIILLMTRSVWLAGFVSLFITLFIYWRFIHQTKVTGKYKMIFISLISLTALLIVISTLFLTVDSKKSFQKQILEATNLKKGNTHNRLILWNRTWLLVKENPIIGVGAGNWKLEISKKNTTQESKGDWKYSLRPHNDYLWVLSESGPLGLLFFISIFGFILYYIPKIIQKTPEDDEKIFMLLMFFIICGYLVFSFFSFPKERIELQLFIHIIFAFVIHKQFRLFNNEKNKTAKKIKVPIKLIVLSIAFILLISSYTTYKRLNVDVGINKIIELQKKGNYNKVIEIAENIYSPFCSIDGFGRPVLYFKGVAQSAVLKSKVTAINTFLEALDDNPYNINTLALLADSYRLMKDKKNTEKYCTKALAYSPNNFTSLGIHTMLMLEEGNEEAVYENFKKISTQKFGWKEAKYAQFMNLIIGILKRKVSILINETNNQSLKQALASLNNEVLWKIFKKANKKSEGNFEKAVLKFIFKSIDKNDPIFKNSEILQMTKKYEIGRK